MLDHSCRGHIRRQPHDERYRILLVPGKKGFDTLSTHIASMSDAAHIPQSTLCRVVSMPGEGTTLYYFDEGGVESMQTQVDLLKWEGPSARDQLGMRASTQYHASM